MDSRVRSEAEPKPPEASSSLGCAVLTRSYLAWLTQLLCMRACIEAACQTEDQSFVHAQIMCCMQQLPFEAIK